MPATGILEVAVEMIRSSPEVLAVSRRWIDAIQYGRENDDTGWSCFTHEVVMANQSERIYHVRNTLILALENGFWKIVHRHGSVPIPNIEFTGSEQTAIFDLIAAARKGISLDQRAGFATIIFTDIVNSTRLASTMGDRLWSSEVARHFASLRKIIESSNGQFVKSLGDGTMSSFPQAADALHAALAILKTIEPSDGPAINLRIGIHTGNVVQADDDFFLAQLSTKPPALLHLQH